MAKTGTTFQQAQDALDWAAGHLGLHGKTRSTNWPGYIGEDFERMIKEARNSQKNSGQGVFAESVKKQFGTIYTPDHVIEATVGLAFKHLDKSLDRTTLKYCDPAAGDGNFFIILYKRLMGDEQFVSKWPNPVDRSRQILTENIWGFEILKAMYMACRIRLVMLHLETVKAYEISQDRNHVIACRQEAEGLVDQLNIHWGNTIKLPQDDAVYEWTDKNGVKHISPDEKIGEGDVLAEELREMKFDVIVGNPPYTHLRNMDNRRYAAYPKQRDLAQVFVRWSFDHLTGKGVCSLNTTHIWLNIKTSDGAIATREVICNRIYEVILNDSTMSYSKGDGGNVGTFLCCFGRQASTMLFNGKPISLDNFYKPGFLQLANYKSDFCYVTLSAYASMVGHTSAQKASKLLNSLYNSFVYDGVTGEQPYLICKRLIGKRAVGLRQPLFHLVCVDDIDEYINTKLNSEVKTLKISYQYGLWLLGFLNCTQAVDGLRTILKDGNKDGSHAADDWLLMVSAGIICNLQVPDFDWYKTNKPQEHAAFLKWVENNMRDKDVFLAGIDAEFEKLIK